MAWLAAHRRETRDAGLAKEPALGRVCRSAFITSDTKAHLIALRFMLPTKLQSKDDIVNALHRAWIEVFTLRDARLPFIVQTQLGEDWVLEESRRPSLSQDKYGRVKVVYPDEDSKQVVMDVLMAPLSAEEVEQANQAGAREDEPEEPSLDDLKESESLVQFESILEDKTITQNHDVSNREEVEEVNPAVQNDDDVFELEKLSSEDNRKSESFIRLELGLEDKTASQNHDVSNTEGVEGVNLAVQNDDDLFEPEEPSSEDNEESESIVEPDQILEDNMITQNQDVSNMEEMERANQLEAQEDVVFEHEKSSSEDKRESESFIQLESILEDNTATQNHDVSTTEEMEGVNKAEADHVLDFEEPSSEDNNESEIIVQPKAILEDKTATQSHDVSNTEEMKVVNPAEADDVLDSEEPSSDDLKEIENIVQFESIPEDKTTTQKDDVRDAQSDAVPVDNWINITFPNLDVKFAVRFHFRLKPRDDLLTSLRFSNA